MTPQDELFEVAIAGASKLTKTAFTCDSLECHFRVLLQLLSNSLATFVLKLKTVIMCFLQASTSSYMLHHAVYSYFQITFRLPHHAVYSHIHSSLQ